MKINVLTLFPEMFTAVTESSILGKAGEKGILDINLINIRDFSLDKNKKADDFPFGGGLGMVMLAQPIFDALKSIDAKGKKIMYMSPRGKILDQAKIEELAEKKSALAALAPEIESDAEGALEKGAALVYPAVAPTKDGYTFDGWYTDKALTTAYDFDTKVTKSFTLYAKWERASYILPSNWNTFITDLAIGNIEKLSIEYSTVDLSGHPTQVEIVAGIYANYTILENGNYDIIIHSNGYIYAPQDCRYYFFNYKALTSITFNNFDTRNTTSMYSMFGGCSKLTLLDLRKLKNSWSDLRASISFNSLTTLRIAFFLL